MAETKARSLKLARSAMTPLLGASATSNIGTGAHFVAIAWFVLLLTGSPARVGGVSAAGMLGLALGSLLGGVAADRLGPWRCSIAFDIAAAIPVAMIPLLYRLHVLTYWQIVVLALAGGILDMPGATARQVMLPPAAHNSDVSLDRANAWMQLATNGAFMLLGPLAAAILIPTIGAANVLFLDAGSYLMSALIIAAALPSHWLSADGRGLRSEVEATSESGSHGLREGLCYIRSQEQLLAVLIAAGWLGFLVAGVVTVIVPALSKSLFDSSAALSAMIWSFGLGLVGGFAGTGALGRRSARESIIRAALIMLVLALWSLRFSHLFVVDVLATLMLGLGLGLVVPLAFSVVALRSPAELLGRVTGIGTAVVFLTAPAGSIVAGLAITWLSLSLVTALGAGLMTAAGLWVLVDRRFRALD